NSCLGMVRQLQHFYSGKKYYGVDLVGNPNFCAIAEAYGFGGYLLEDDKDIKDCVSKWLSHKGTSLLEVKVSKEDMVFPMVMGGASLEDMLLED
ncbi:MAG: thiamine pyrophosphate-dependent enzyme, partial [Clostridiales bacterium]